jgi:hypothetical protein
VVLCFILKFHLSISQGLGHSFLYIWELGSLLVQNPKSPHGEDSLESCKVWPKNKMIFWFCVLTLLHICFFWVSFYTLCYRKCGIYNTVCTGQGEPAAPSPASSPSWLRPIRSYLCLMWDMLNLDYETLIFSSDHIYLWSKVVCPHSWYLLDIFGKLSMSKE